jgi:hypothetical protein
VRPPQYGEHRELRLLRRLVAVLPILIVGVVGRLDPAAPFGAAEAAPVVDTFPDDASASDDPRVRAFLEAYGTVVDSVSYVRGDVVFTLAGHRVYFQDGRMLSGNRRRDAERFDPVFYAYPLGPLLRPAPLTERPHYSVDVFEALFGTTEHEIRTHCRSASFLGHRMFVNLLILDPLREVEREIRDAAAVDPSVRAWIADLEITYSFMFRGIAGSQTPSLHAFGLAVDLVPSSYGGRHVYWRWSRALDRQNWYRVPPSQRWSPPQAVIRAFENNGFVWGGKWAHFDAIHFEYRPEILIYNRHSQLDST